MANGKKSADDHLVAEALRELEIQAVNFAYRFVNDSRIRADYISCCQQFSRELRRSYNADKLTARQAEELAHAMRNEVMKMMRAKSSDIGRAVAAKLKQKGLALDNLVTKYARERFGKRSGALTAAQREAVALEIVAAAGRPNPKFSAGAARLGAVGRGLWVLTAVIAIYNLGTAENKAVAAGREVANVGGGVLGGMATGAAAGIWLGPVGAAIGAAIGGILGAAIADEAYVEKAVPRSATVDRILPRFSGMFWRDEAGLANALYDECGINMDQVAEMLKHLNEFYSTDADDVAHLYVQLVKKHGGSVLHALKMHPSAKAMLIDTLESGWTDTAERQSILFLQSLR